MTDQLMICPKAAECYGCKGHRVPHKHTFDCDESGDDCPRCVPVEHTPDPVDDPQPVNLSAIRDRVKQTRATHWPSTARERAREMCTTIIDADVPAMCAEIESLRRDLAASRQEIERLKSVVMIRDAMLDGVRAQRDELRAYCEESLDISGVLAEEVVSLTYERDELRRRLEQALPESQMICSLAGVCTHELCKLAKKHSHDSHVNCGVVHWCGWIVEDAVCKVVE